MVRVPVKLIEELREKDPVLHEIEGDAEVVRTALRLFLKQER